jgi:hypothetical protein
MFDEYDEFDLALALYHWFITGNVSEIEHNLQLMYNELFDNSKVVKDMISKVQDSNDYYTDEYGEVCQWVHVDLGDFKPSQSYFSDYMLREHFITVDFTNDTLSMSQGESIFIQNDTRHDNGVWFNRKCIIKESDYKDEETNEVDEAKRNELIEKYMEKTGCFPGVFRIDYHGNVFPVNMKGN